MDCYQRLQSMNTYIDGAKTLTDLIPMLRHIELDMLKEVLKDNINNTTAHPLMDNSKLFYSSLSIETLMPMDILDNIVSFHNISQNKLISKTFHKCYKRNKRRELKAREVQIQSQLKTNEGSKTWVVHPTRSVLTTNEINLKQNGPINSLHEALAIAQDGDKILMHDGVYSHEQNKVLDSEHSVQIIGCGKNVQISNCCLFKIRNDIYFKNIHIETCGDGLEVFGDCTLFMENCHIQPRNGIGIYLYYSASLCITNCNIQSDFPINISAAAKIVQITGCTFSRCGGDKRYPCINVIRQCTAELKIIDNLFINNKGVPIGSTLDTMSNRYCPNVIFKYNRSGLRNDNDKDLLSHFCDSGFKVVRLI
eukprot:105259_1